MKHVALAIAFDLSPHRRMRDVVSISWLPARALLLGHSHNVQRHCYRAVGCIQESICMQQRKTKAEEATASGGRAILRMEHLQIACRMTADGHCLLTQ
jgi:hypothetical protein